MWLRFVDDTFVIQKAEHSQQFLQHINTRDPNLQFTVEEPDQDGSLPFLDTKVTPGPNSTLNTTVYRMPAHRDQYLHWDSNHFTTAKHSVYNTLAHRAKVVSRNQESLNKELEHIRMALHCCHFPTWAFNKPQQNFQCRNYNSNEPTQQTTKTPTTPTMGPTSTTKTTRRTFSWWFLTYRDWVKSLKGHATGKEYKYTTRDQTPSKLYSWHPKTRTPNYKRIGSYTNTSAQPSTVLKSTLVRAFGDRLKEHIRAPSPIHHHTSSAGHPINPDCFSIVHRGAQGTTRNIKEAMYIRANDPSLNRNLGKYQLPHVWDQILQDTSALKLK